MKKRALLPVLCLGVSLCAGLLSACGEQRVQTLKDIYKDYFSIGAAINGYTVDNKNINEFNSITLENEMKWSQVHPTEDSYTFLNADVLVAKALNRNQKVRGHALVWHEAVPETVFLKEGGGFKTKDELLAVERDHVDTVVTHFADDVYCWDVVNEAIDDNDATPLKSDKSNVYRKSTWYDICGSDFIKTAFIQADATLKELGIRDKVKLYYNDYGNTGKNKLDKTVAMIEELQQANVPIDGIGLQCHYHLGSFNQKELDEAITTYANLGLDVQITEFDCEVYDTSLAEIPDYKKYENSSNPKDPQVLPDENKYMHAAIYDRAFEVLRAHKDDISCVTFWGVTDTNCYMNQYSDTNPRYGYHTNYPFLFSVKDEKKNNYYAISEFGNNVNNHYNPYKNMSARLNVYDGKKQDFHVTDLTSSNRQIVLNPEKQSDGSYKVQYYNVDGYDYIGTTVKGRLADFLYINIEAKGTPGKGISLRLLYGDKDDETRNVLGDDVSFSLTEDFAVHSLKIKGIYHTRMDLLRIVSIYPELGVQNVNGAFYYKDIWFSSEPAGEVENPGVDSGDSSKTINGWKTEAWTQYTLYKSGNYTGVKYTEAAEYAAVTRKIDIPETDNELSISFENKMSADGITPSVTCIHIYIVGDWQRHVDAGPGVPYEYDLYYESQIYFYDLTRPGEVEAEDGITTLTINIADALADLKNVHYDGYSLKLNIESDPADKAKYTRDRDGEIILRDVSTYYNPLNEAKKYFFIGDQNQVEIEEKDGVDQSISWTNVKGDSYGPILYRRINATHDQIIHVVIENTSLEEIQVSIHAGILNDARSDLLNHFFYPLYCANAGAKNPAGYFTDGENNLIPAGETLEVDIKVDEDLIYLLDEISTIEFIFDASYGDTTVRSGSCDIKSISVNA